MFKTVACPQRPAWPRQPGHAARAGGGHRVVVDTMQPGDYRSASRGGVPGAGHKTCPEACRICAGSVRYCEPADMQWPRQPGKGSPAARPCRPYIAPSMLMRFTLISSMACHHNQNARRRCVSEPAADEAAGSGVGLCQSPLLNIMRRAVAPWY